MRPLNLSFIRLYFIRHRRKVGPYRFYFRYIVCVSCRALTNLLLRFMAYRSIDTLTPIDVNMRLLIASILDK